MNVAFPALSLFLVVLSGFVFLQFFLRNEIRTAYHVPFHTAVFKQAPVRNDSTRASNEMFPSALS